MTDRGAPGGGQPVTDNPSIAHTAVLGPNFGMSDVLLPAELEDRVRAFAERCSRSEPIRLLVEAALDLWERTSEKRRRPPRWGGFAGPSRGRQLFEADARSQ